MYDRKLIDYLPPIIKEIREIKAIMEAQQPEMVKIWQAYDDALSDQFIESATEYGVKRWEKILKIIPKATDNLNARKFTILARINEQLPFTMITLRNTLKSLCGEDGFTLTLNHENYTLYVQVELVAKSNYTDVGDMLDRVVPANMVINISLKYNQQTTLAKFTHGQLQQWTHDQLRNEVLT